MADGTELNLGSGGDIISTDDIAGVKVQRVKVQFGVDGSATDVSASDPLPVVADLPTGAATAAKQDTGNTSLATLAGAVAGTEVQVDVLTMPSIAGTVTANAGTNLNTSALALEAGGNLAAAATSLAALDNAVSGNELQVDVVGALPAGTNAIGKLAANSGVDIGDVDVLSVVPGTGATNLGKAEDAAHTTGDVGVMALAVRAAAPTERSAGPTDGDYEPLAVNEVGALWASMTPSANGGASTMNASSSDGATALTSTAQAIKASAGVLLGYYIYNPNATAQFVQFYNTASGSVTVGTTNPLFMLTIPATSAANLAFPYGIAFATAMSWAATSTAGGNGAPSTALDAVCFYK